MAQILGAYNFAPPGARISGAHVLYNSSICELVTRLFRKRAYILSDPSISTYTLCAEVPVPLKGVPEV